MDITQILLSAQSADQTARVEAERVLKEAEQNNFAAYLVRLVDQLAGDSHDPESRRLAGLIVKNAIDARDPAVRNQMADRWIQTVDEPSKTHIRSALLNALAATQPEPRRAAAQVISKIAGIDLARPGAWDSLISDLLNNATSQTSEDHLRQSSLEALGYICEEAAYGDITDQILSAHSNQILTAVIQGMSYAGGQNSNEHGIAAVRLAATVALNNALEFARSQFEIPVERTAIVSTVCEAARAGNNQVRQAAFEGLVKIAENYYDKLHEYIADIYSLTENAIRNDAEPVAMQAIEFWSTVAEEEIALIFEAEAARETGTSPDRESKKFVIHALPYLSGPIFDTLKKQEDDPLEDHSWNAATAAGACVELLAQAAPDTILNIVRPFIETNIQDHANWRSREAAILAFGSVLEGPPIENIKVLVREAVGILIETLVKDSNLAVKDTTAWTLARVISVDRDTTQAHLRPLVECLRGTLSTAESPVLAAHICFAIHNLAERFYEEAEEETGPLREHVEVLLGGLLQAADRDDASEGHLRVAAYEAVNAIFRSVSKDGIPFVLQCVPIFLEKLRKTLEALPCALSEDDVSDMLEMQGLLCAALSTATQRLNSSQIAPYADAMMEAYLQAFRMNGSAAAVEEALIAVGPLAEAAGKDFNRYMPHFSPTLGQALSNVTHHQICAIAVSVVSELCRALGKDILNYSDNIAYLLLEALKSSALERSVKPPILSCFGDIAMAVKGSFEKYLKQVMECMKQAAESSVRMEVSPEDYDSQEWILQLREAIFEAYIGIINGLRDEGKQELLTPYVEWILTFCEVIVDNLAQPSDLPDDIIKPVAGLCGDLVEAVPGIKAHLSSKNWLASLVNRGANSPDERTKEVSKWAASIIFQS
eukprot:GFKZ01002918.1.p1 GENE.GFKZ01002918.1~~GFKZ01002918.1.p1  ORF type:complete len:900 (-),score=168.63 GFKZ01002918.1:226-2877(-)